MRKRTLGLMALVLITSLYTTGLYGKPVGYKNGWTKSILGEWVEEDEYVSVFLDEQVYAHARKDLGDLRIVGDKGEEIPYYITQSSDTLSQGKVNYTVLVENEWIKEGWAYTDVKIKEYSESSDVLINKLKLQMVGEDYAQRVKIYGSYDQMNWNFIKEDVVFDVAVGESTEISFLEAVKYPFYRIARQQEQKEVRLEGTEAQYNWEEDKVDAYHESKKWDYKQTEKEKATHLTFDNSNHLPFYQIELTIPGNFRRDYTLWGTNEDKERICLGEGSLYAMDFEELSAQHTTVPVVNGRDYSLFEVVIENHDDRPLDIKEAIGTYEVHKLVFKRKENRAMDDIAQCSEGGDGILLELLENPNEGAMNLDKKLEGYGEDKVVGKIGDGESYTLNYGDQSLEKPLYDIETYQQNIERLIQIKASLGEEMEITHKKNTFSLKGVFTFVVIALSGILIFIIVKGLKKKDF